MSDSISVQILIPHLLLTIFFINSVLINAGGDAVVDALGRTWMADAYFSGGQTYSDGRFDISGTQDDYIYRKYFFACLILLGCVHAYLY